MRLQRQSIKDSEVRGKWYFNIIGKDSELVEKAEHLLRDMGWEDECDGVIFDCAADAARHFKISSGLVTYRVKSDKWNWFYINA
ncbi:hypothetical protein vBEcoMWL3_00735 [Escherichia phage ph0021]|nr:hypothetical protein vBEcoMWL3_00735 [Escherichia phage ph0021]